MFTFNVAEEWGRSLEHDLIDLSSGLGLSGSRNPDLNSLIDDVSIERSSDSDQWDASSQLSVDDSHIVDKKSANGKYHRGRCRRHHSLPSPRYVDWLAEQKQKWYQIPPLPSPEVGLKTILELSEISEPDSCRSNDDDTTNHKYHLAKLLGKHGKNATGSNWPNLVFSHFLSTSLI